MTSSPTRRLQAIADEHGGNRARQRGHAARWPSSPSPPGRLHGRSPAITIPAFQLAPSTIEIDADGAPF
jgi:hypothetical protein